MKGILPLRALLFVAVALAYPHIAGAGTLGFTRLSGKYPIVNLILPKEAGSIGVEPGSSIFLGSSISTGSAASGGTLNLTGSLTKTGSGTQLLRASIYNPRDFDPRMVAPGIIFTIDPGDSIINGNSTYTASLPTGTGSSTVTLANPVILNSTSVLSGNLTLSAGTTVTSNNALTLNAGTLTLNRALTGSSSLTLAESQHLTTSSLNGTLSGVSVNGSMLTLAPRATTLELAPPVPEPGSATLAAIGLLVLAIRRRRP